jgi:hypothetical protein
MKLFLPVAIPPSILFLMIDNGPLYSSLGTAPMAQG